jgi:hypothetical protein
MSFVRLLHVLAVLATDEKGSGFSAATKSTWPKNALSAEVVALGDLIQADTRNSFLIVGIRGSHPVTAKGEAKNKVLGG